MLSFSSRRFGGLGLLAFSACSGLCRRTAASISFNVVDSDGEKTRVSGNCGSTLLSVLQAADMSIESPCDGCMSCGMCRVRLQPPQGRNVAWQPSSSKESSMISRLVGKRPSPPGSFDRLACGVKLSEDMQDMTVVLPPS